MISECATNSTVDTMEMNTVSVEFVHHAEISRMIVPVLSAQHLIVIMEEDMPLHEKVPHAPRLDVIPG